MSERRQSQQATVRSALVRGVSFVLVWIAIAGVNPLDLVVGIFAATLAVAASLLLLPPGQFKVSPAAFFFLFLRFLKQSLIAGVDVAWRALDPRLPVKPGFVVFRPTLPAGPKRDAFCTMTSLLPGTLPCGPADDGGLFIHCLDTRQPVAEQLAGEEALFIKAVGGPRQ